MKFSELQLSEFSKEDVKPLGLNSADTATRHEIK